MMIERRYPRHNDQEKQQKRKGRKQHAAWTTARREGRDTQARNRAWLRFSTGEAVLSAGRGKGKGRQDLSV
jgi:hypothetical protein